MGENWHINFNWSLTDEDLTQRGELMLELQFAFQADELGKDTILWGLEKSGLYNTKSLYKTITHGGVTSRVGKHIWKCKIPSKIKIFLWQMHHGKLPAATVLKRRGWKGDHQCSLCGAAETINHIFFQCPLGAFIWCCIRDAFGWEGFPSSLTDFMENWLPNKFNTHKIFLQVLLGQSGEPETRWQ